MNKKITTFLFVLLGSLSMLLAACNTTPSGGHTHTASSTWASDETYHWHTCETCQELLDKAEHTFKVDETPATYEKDGEKVSTCEICSYVKRETLPKLEHTYSSDWSTNATNHWHACLDEGYEDLKKDNATHSFVRDASKDTSNKEAYVCSVCNYLDLRNKGSDDPSTLSNDTFSYNFLTKSWGTSGNDWKSNKDGNQFDTSKNAVQVTASGSGASATSKNIYDAVEEISFTYCSNSKSGEGNIEVNVGGNSYGRVSLNSNGGSTFRTVTIQGADFLTGIVSFTVNCSKNSLYIQSISITCGSSVPTDPTSISIGNNLELIPGSSKQLEVTYTPRGANQNKEVTWSSNSSSITVSNSGLVNVSSNASIGEEATITATLTNIPSISASIKVTVVEQKADAWTIMIYICGSDLESDQNSGLATEDIKEILSVSNQPDDVNIIIETGGASKWSSKYGISASKLQRWHVENKQLVKDADLTKASMGQTSTFQSFLNWGLSTYPAEKTGVILWNHGGAMDGCCFDENYNDDCLTPSEVNSAFSSAFNSNGITDKLEFVGYDCCLMQVQDIAELNSQYFKYMVAAQESEAGEGWEYTTWVDDLYAYKSTETILKAVCDGFISSYDSTYGAQGYANDQTLSVLDLSKMEAYKTAFESFATNASSLIKNNKSAFATVLKNSKNYADTYLEKSDYQDYLSYGYQEYMFDRVTEDGQTYYLLHGYYDYGSFDAKDVLTKLKANAAFSSLVSDINNVLNALNDVIYYNKIGGEAGNSNGLCLIVKIGYTNYNASDTNFTNWRNLVSNLFTGELK